MEIGIHNLCVISGEEDHPSIPFIYDDCELVASEAFARFTMAV